MPPQTRPYRDGPHHVRRPRGYHREETLPSPGRAPPALRPSVCHITRRASLPSHGSFLLWTVQAPHPRLFTPQGPLLWVVRLHALRADTEFLCQPPPLF